MAKVSVVVPVYGVEKYIERCARSLFEQTLKDIEYIFVDDCSQDNSIGVLKSIIDEYNISPNSVKILKHDSNKGLPVARQTGIRAATGDYIAHCDSDDWVTKTTYEEMYNEAILKNADIVVCDINNTDGRNNTYEKCLRSTSKWSFVKDMFYSQVTWSNCNKLFRRSLYDNNYYTTTNAMGEDLTITLQIAYYAKVIAYVHKPFYCYYSNPASIMKVASTEAVERKYFQMLSNVQIIQRFYENKNVGFDINKAIKGLLLHCSVILVPALNDKNEKLWKNNNKQFGIYPLLDSCVRLRYKAIFCAYRMGIYSMLKRLSHIL